MNRTIDLLTSTSRFAIAAAIVYFAYQLAQIGGQVGSVTGSVDREWVTEQIPPTLEEVRQVRLAVDEIRKQLPEILAEVEEVRTLVPPILDEVAATRAQIPPILDEVARVREQLPALLERIDAVNRQIDPVLKQLEATVAVVDGAQKQIPEILSTADRAISSIDNTREQVVPLVPLALEEARLTREQVEPTLDRVENLLDDAYVKAQNTIASAQAAGQEASEGAVKGFFTGVIKLPFKLVGTLASPITRNLSADVAEQLTEKDIELMADTGNKAVLSGSVDRERVWENPNSGNSGSITILRYFELQGLECIEARIKINNRRKQILDKLNEFCRTEDGQWTLASETGN